MIVIDATILAKAYFPEALSEPCLALLFGPDPIVVSESVWVGFSRLIADRVRQKLITWPEAERILNHVPKLAITSEPTLTHLKDAVELAVLCRRSVEECLPIALAMRHQTVLVTADRQWLSLMNTSPLRAHIRLVEPA